MTRRLLALLGSVLLMASLSDCGGPEQSRLAGPWRVDEVSADYGELPVDPAGEVVFGDDGTWKAFDGCGEFRGTYDLRSDDGFSADVTDGSEAQCPQEGFDVTRIMTRAQAVTVSGCQVTLRLHGEPLLTLSNCERSSDLGGGLPPSE